MLELITTQRLKTEESIPEEFLLVLDSICLSSKNIYNAALFIAKNVLSNYTYDKDSKNYKLKDKRHQNEIDMLVLANNAIGLVNEKKSKKEKDNLEESNESDTHSSTSKNKSLSQYTEEISQGNQSQRLGKRINRKFITKDKITIHADVNGAFNIARKILKGFKYDRKSNNTKFDLVIVSKWGHKKFSKTIASSVARRS